MKYEHSQQKKVKNEKNSNFVYFRLERHVRR